MRVVEFGLEKDKGEDGVWNVFKDGSYEVNYFWILENHYLNKKKFNVSNHMIVSLYNLI